MGALTSKPYAFVSRPWELKSIESIDVFDSYLSSIRYDYRGTQVLRVLPSINSQLNSEWITDKVRFHYDSIVHQRLTNPWLKSSLVTIYLNKVIMNYPPALTAVQLLPSSWTFFLEVMQSSLNLIKSAGNLNFFNFFGISEGLNSINSSLNVFYKTGSSNSIKTSFFNNRRSYQFELNRLLKSELCVLVNSNPRLELPLLNLKMRELVNSGKLEVFTFGSNLSLNFFTKSAGAGIISFYEFISGRGLLSTYLLKFRNPFFIFGIKDIADLKLKNLFDSVLFKILNKEYPSYISNSLFNDTTSINLAEFGLSQTNFVNLNSIQPSLFYLSNVDNIFVAESFLNLKNNLVQMGFLNNLILYAGSHGDFSVDFADFIIPVASNSECSDVYLNLELKMKNSKVVLQPPFAQVRSVVAFNNIFQFLFKDNYFSLFSSRIKFDYNKHKIALDSVKNFNLNSYRISLYKNNFVNNNYLINSVTRSSQFLTLAYNNFKQKFKNFKD